MAATASAGEAHLGRDIFQVVLSQRFDLALDADPFDVYRALRLLNPSLTSTSCASPKSRWWAPHPRPMGAPARRAGDLAAHRRVPAAW